MLIGKYSSLGAAFIERFEELNSGGRRGRSRLPHNDKSTPNAKRVKVRPPAVTLSTQQQIEALKKIDLDELKMANPISIVAPGAGPEPAIKSTKAALAHSRTAEQLWSTLYIEIEIMMQRMKISMKMI